MEQNQKLGFKKTLIPSLDFVENKNYVILNGCQDATRRPIISTSFSNTSCTFSAPPPSPFTAVSRKVTLELPVSLNFTGVAPQGVNLLQSGYDAFRAYPIASIIESLTIELGGLSQTIQLADVIAPLTRVDNEFKQRTVYDSIEPTALDMSQSYTELDLSVFNPLNSIIDSSLSYQLGRGAYPVTNFVNEQLSAQVDAILHEDLRISPMMFGKQDEPNAFFGLQTFQVTINWRGDLTRLWSHSSGSPSTINTIQVTLGQPVLHFHYITPPAAMKIPKNIFYSYYPLRRYTTNIQAAVQPATQVTLQSSNIQLNSIPKRMYLAVRRRNADQSFLTTDTFFRMLGVSINWNNRNGILSGATDIDLYNIYKANGGNLPWPLWNGENMPFASGGDNTLISGVGGVLPLDFGKDIPLHDGEAPGMLGTYQLQLSVDVRNIASEEIFPSLYVIVVEEGVFEIKREELRVISEIGVVKEADVMKSYNVPIDIRYKYYQKSLYGGDVLSDIKHFGKQALQWINKNKSWLIPVATTAAKLLTMGLGLEEPQMKGSAISIAGSDFDVEDILEVRDALKDFRDYTGGKKMTKKTLQKKMKQL